MPARRSNRPPFVVGLAWAYREWGGAQTHLLCLASQLVPRHRVVAFVPQGSADALGDLARSAGIELAIGGAAVATTATRGLPAKLARRVGDTKANLDLVRAIARHRPRPDVLHVDMPIWNSTLAILALLRIVPIVQTFHTPMPAPRRHWRDRWLRNKFKIVARRHSYRLVAATNSAAQSLRPWVGDGCRIDVIGVVDLDAVNAAACEPRESVLRRLGIPPERTVIGTLGQLIPRKGLDTVLLAAAELVDRSGIDLHVLFGGDGESKESLRMQAEHLGLADRLTIVDPACLGSSHSDHVSLLRGLDVLAMPSRDEGMPLTLLEGLALGLPAVASAVGAIPSELTDGTHLLLVSPDRPDQLARALSNLLTDPARARSLGSAAALHVREAFDPARAGERHEAVLAELVAQR